MNKGEYRYLLHRSWTIGMGCLCWVMLNPSTADEVEDDPTIRRCIRFSQDAGYGQMLVVNLFAARSTKPKHLATFADPVGDNDRWTGIAIRDSDAVVFAFGASAVPGLDILGRIATVYGQCIADNKMPLCLGMTKDGWPRHPLYVAADQPLRPWQAKP